MCPDVEVRRVMDDLMSLPEGPFGAIEATSGKRSLAGPHEAIEQVEVGWRPHNRHLKPSMTSRSNKRSGKCRRRNSSGFAASPPE